MGLTDREVAGFTVDATVRTLAAARPDRTAWSCGRDRVSFAELDRRGDQVAHGLRALGVAAGDRVAYVARNRGELFEIAVGCARAGAVLTPLNWRLPAEQVAGLVTDSAATVCFTEPEFAVHAGTEARVVEFGDGYRQWRSRADDTPVTASSGHDDVCIQFYTSGTTGPPKGVEITHHNLAYLMRAGEQWRLGPDAVAAAAMPFFHMGGSAWGLVAVLSGGHCVVVPEFDPSDYLGLIEEHRVTNLLLAPTMLRMLLDVPGVQGRDLSSVQGIVYGSAPVTLPLLREVIATFDAPLLQVFGLTETCGGVTQLEPQDHVAELLTSVGKPYPWVETSIRAQDESPLPIGETGEIWIRSSQCSRGYWRRPDATAELRTPDGWIRTGDAGRLDHDGFLFITDRIKDMIITGGENVYPAEVERVLVEHSDVAEVAVFGVPDRLWGEAVVADVVPRESAAIDSGELMRWLRPRLAGYMIPKRIDVLAELPRNAAGKILKQQLRERNSE